MHENEAFSYSSGKAYYRRVTDAELTYDRLLSDLEVIFDPARGSSSDKLVLCSLPVISFFNKLGDGKFLSASMSHSNNPYQYGLESRTGEFGHKVMMIDTVHGSLNLVKEPLFRGQASGFMLMADMSQLAYRPLIGNLLTDTPVMWAAALFYILYVFGMALVVIQPCVDSASIFKTIYTGFVFVVQVWICAVASAYMERSTIQKTAAAPETRNAS